jgi:hypothetical protein
MSAGEAGTLIECVKMGLKCACPEIALNGLEEFKADSHFSKLAAEAEKAFRAFLATPQTHYRLKKARLHAATLAFVRLENRVENLYRVTREKTVRP